MDLIICKDSLDLARTVSNHLLLAIKDVRARAIYLPAGRTPTSVYQIWEAEKPSELTGVQFLQVDEILNGPERHVFRRYFRENLPSYQDQFVPVEAEHPVAPIALLGLGLNGHVAFHEPNLPPAFAKGEVELSDSSLHELTVNGTRKALTYGIGTFQECKKIFIMVSGEKKKNVLTEVLRGNLDYPAAHLLSHSGLSLLADQAAYLQPNG